MTSVFKTSLYRNPGIEIKRSPIHGWGIFSRRNLKKYSLIEEVPYIVVSNPEKSEIIKYTYSYDDEHFMLSFGFSALYNHSSDPNADWMKDYVNMTIKHFTTKDISAGEEIFIDYGEENIDFDIK